MADIDEVMDRGMQTAKEGTKSDHTRIRALAHSQRQAALLGKPIPPTLEETPFPEDDMPLSLSHIDQGLRTSRS
ncbi:MAG: hypothetical protein ABIB97_03750 [Patescibacteria group bacterium]